jgi:hypothetical protein
MWMIFTKWWPVPYASLVFQQLILEVVTLKPKFSDRLGNLENYNGLCRRTSTSVHGQQTFNLIPICYPNILKVAPGGGLNDDFQILKTPERSVHNLKAHNWVTLLECQKTTPEIWAENE